MNELQLSNHKILYDAITHVWQTLFEAFLNFEILEVTTTRYKIFNLLGDHN